MRAALESLAVFLEREAGYHFVSLAVIALGITIAEPQVRGALARDLVIFGLGVLSRSMGGKPATPPAGSVTFTKTDQITKTPEA